MALSRITHWGQNSSVAHLFFLQLCWDLGFPGGSAGKESTCNAGDPGFIPGLGRSPGEEKDYSLQYSGLESSTDCMVRGESQTQLSYFHICWDIIYVQDQWPILKSFLKKKFFFFGSSFKRKELDYKSRHPGWRILGKILHKWSSSCLQGLIKALVFGTLGGSFSPSPVLSGWGQVSMRGGH